MGAEGRGGWKAEVHAKEASYVPVLLLLAMREAEGGGGGGGGGRGGIFKEGDWMTVP